MTHLPAFGGGPTLPESARPASELTIGADLNGILNAVNLPIIVVDRTGIVVRFNRAATVVLGLAHTHIGQRSTEVPALAQLKDIERLCVRAITDEVPYRGEFQNSERCFTLHIAPCRQTDGRVDGAVITCTNVTAFRASLEQAIYEREYTKAILNAVMIALVVLDSDLRVQTANRAFYELFGVSREAAHRRALVDLGDDDWQTLTLWTALRAALSTAAAFKAVELECNLPAIGRRTLLVDARRLPLAANPAVLLALQDITERKQAEKALQESEERYRVLFASMDEAFCTVEVLFDDQKNPVDYRFLEVNGAFERQTGIKDPKGRLMREIAPLHEQHWFDIYGKIALTGEPARFENQARELHRWYDVYAFRIGLPKDNQVAILFNDITQRRRTQEALKEVDRRKDEFLATLAHELRNPLAPIRNSLEIVKQSHANPALLQRAHSIIDRQVLHMERLVDDLLDISRITSDKLELRKERIELKSIIHQSVEAYRPLAERADLAMTVAVPPDPVYLDGDAVRLAQLFGNLLNNACKYTERGGRIAVSLRRQDSDVTVSIKDTGVGIPPDMLLRIFEMFTQINRSLKRSQGGLGIGLSLVKRLVEMHGGEIEAFSAGSGHGSEFLVRLPLRVEPLASQQFDTSVRT